MLALFSFILFAFCSRFIVRFLSEFVLHSLPVCAGFATIWPCLVIWARSVFAIWGYSIGGGGGGGGLTWLGRGKYWYSCRASGGFLPFCQGGWELCSVIYYLFLISLSTGGRVRNRS